MHKICYYVNRAHGERAHAFRIAQASSVHVPSTTLHVYIIQITKLRTLALNIISFIPCGLENEGGSVKCKPSFT